MNIRQTDYSNSTGDKPQGIVIHGEIKVDATDKDFYGVKLEQRFQKLKKYIFFSFFICFMDILATFAYPSLFCTFPNIFSLLIYILALGFCLITFRHQFLIVNVIVYRSVVRMIYSLGVAIGLVYLSIFYTVLVKVLFNVDIILSLLFQGKYSLLSNSYTDPSVFYMALFGFIMYMALNFSFPFFIIYKLSQVKTTLGSLGKASGEDYVMTSVDQISTDRAGPGTKVLD